MRVSRSVRRVLTAAVGALLLWGGVSARQDPVWSPVDIPTLNRILVTQDFDNDGIPDRVLVVADTVGVVLSHSDGSVSSLGHRTSVVGLVADDVDHDGDPDILTLTTAGNLWLWRNDGRGRFAVEHVVPAEGLAGSMTASIRLTAAGEFTSPSDGPGWGWRPLGLTPLGSIVAAPREARPWTRFTSVASLEAGLRAASPRAPPHALAIV